MNQPRQEKIQTMFTRFFGKKGENDPTGLLVANTQLKDPLSLEILFGGQLALESATVTKALRSLHRSLSGAQCEIDPTLSQQGKIIGFAGWGKHVIRLVGFAQPMPAESVEFCVAPSHWPQALKEQARAHSGHVVLFYAGYDPEPLEQYVALASVARVLARLGGIVVLNEAAHTCMSAEVLADPETKGDPVELLRTLPLLMLYCGFVKYDVEGTEGVWMRTYGADRFGLPDFAILAASHDEGQKYFELFENMLGYLRQSGAEFAAGHTMQVGEDTYLRLRQPAKKEYFLESKGQLFVAELIGAKQINER